MSKRKMRFRTALLFTLSAIVLFSALYHSVPNQITAFEGENLSERPVYGTHCFLPSRFRASVSADSNITAAYQTTANLFGMIPIKTVNVDVMPATALIPCGDPIGLKLYTDGLLVIQLDTLESTDGKTVSPAQSAGLKVGDIILEYNGIAAENIDNFTETVNQCGAGTFSVKIVRGEKEQYVKIKPYQDKTDNLYKIGAWVRDSTAGIGTLTFYNPQTQQFAALGHGIVDSDIGAVYHISGGDMESATILSVAKGQRGIPGELKGIFASDSTIHGRVERNTPSGVYGVLTDPDTMASRVPLEVASHSMIQTGAASILCAVSGNTVQEYEIEIQKILPNDESSKSMIIKITDPALLEKTGGIVQGMSGSPILQNGKLVGAVTHVFVNDPTRGYGIFIENMLAEAENIFANARLPSASEHFLSFVLFKKLSESILLCFQIRNPEPHEIRVWDKVTPSSRAHPHNNKTRTVRAFTPTIRVSFICQVIFVHCRVTH